MASGKSSFSISNITSALSQTNGIVNQSHFLVTITPPSGVSGGTLAGVNSQILPLFCTRAMLPGIQFGVRQIKQSGYGIVEKRPIAAGYDPMVLTFMCDAKGYVYQFFHRWFQMIHNINGRLSPDTTINGLRNFEFQYPDNYESPMIEIQVFDPTGAEVVVYSIYQAYPMYMEDSPVGWEMKDAIVEIRVTFAYNWWNSNLQDLSTKPAKTDGVLFYNGFNSTAGGANPGPNLIQFTNSALSGE